MILVDKEIKKLIEDHQLIIAGYCSENLNGVSYDLTIDYTLDEDGKECVEYDLRPGETVFIKTQEELSIPENILGRVAEKNSRMRQGIVVSGPDYQPGHRLFLGFRIFRKI